MERLTYRLEDQYGNPTDSIILESDLIFLNSSEKWKKVLSRLAAYEDTGLEPEEIISAVDMAKVACALEELNAYKELGSLDRLRELAEADRVGWCVVLPRLETGQGDPPGDPGPQGPPGLCPNCNDWRGLVWDKTTGDSRCTICGWTNAKT